MYNLKQARNLDKIDLEELKMQIKHGNKDAMFALGMMYLNGVRVQQDTEKAVAWLNKAAMKMQEDAAYNLSLIYLTAQFGVPCHIKKGRDYLELAAKSGRTDLYAFLKRIDDKYRPLKYQAEAFDESLMLPPAKEEEQAGAWRFVPHSMPNPSKLIGLGLLAAGFFLFFTLRISIFMFVVFVVFGVFFLMVNPPKEHMPKIKKKPDFTESDLASEKVFNEKLAEEDLRDLEYMANHKDIEAMYKMGYMHYNGIRLDQDYAKAASWYQRAAMLRHPSATFAIGIMYMKGQGVKFNLTKGLDFLEMSASYGNEDAKNIERRIRRAYKGQKMSEVEFDESLLDNTAPDVIPLTKRKSFKVAIIFGVLLFLPAFIISNMGEFLALHAKFIFYPILYLFMIRYLILAALILTAIFMLRDGILKTFLK